MKKFFGLITMLLVAGNAVALAQETRGYLFVPFGHVRQPNGSLKDISGSWLPYTMVPVNTRVLNPIQPAFSFTPPRAPVLRMGGGNQTRTITKVYQADSGSGYAE